MTILERMKALFNKKPIVIQPYIRFEKKDVKIEDFEEDFDVSTIPPFVPNKGGYNKFYTDPVVSQETAVSEIKSKYTTKYTDPITLQEPTIVDDSDLYTRFMREVPGKRVFYGGNETKAYLKWKEDNDL